MIPHCYQRIIFHLWVITLTPPQRTLANRDGKPVINNYSTMHQILDEHLPLTLTDFTFLPILIRFIRSKRLFFPSLGVFPVPSGTGSLSLSIIGLVCSSSDMVKIQRIKMSQCSNCTAAFVSHKISLRISASFFLNFLFFLPLFNGNCQTLFTEIEWSQETKMSHHLNLNSNL